MALAVTRGSDAVADLATMADSSVLGSITIPGRAEEVRTARRFVAGVLGQLGTVTETAVLLTSELVTNAVQHSHSGRPGGTVTVIICRIAGEVRLEVTDNGSDHSSPVVKDEVLSPDGHGLFLVEALARQWGYRGDSAGTTVWCQLTA
jgi:anti-sigma regulatory factor (Ser/Thr protein kinase)